MFERVFSMIAALYVPIAKQLAGQAQVAASGTTQVVEQVKPRKNFVLQWGIISAFRALVYDKALSKEQKYQKFKPLAQEMYKKTEEYWERPMKPSVNLCSMVKRKNFTDIAKTIEHVTQFQAFPDNSPEKLIYNKRMDEYMKFLGKVTGVFVECELAEAMYYETLLIQKKWDKENDTTTKECRDVHDAAHAAWARHWYMPDPRVEVQPPVNLGPNAAWESTRYEYGDDNVPGCSIYSSSKMAEYYLAQDYVLVY